MTLPSHVRDSVLGLIAQRTGLKFLAGCLNSAERGVQHAMNRAGVSDPDQYADRLSRDDRALDALVDELTVGETYFFREPEQFKFLESEVLPEIIGRLGRQHIVRAWSAGCATGEEAYSLAILFERQGLAEQAHVLATDISKTGLARACQATYGPWSMRGEGAGAARPYLRQEGDRLVVDERIRRRVTLEYLNLALDTYPSFATGTWGMDLILCRNVFIYFDCDTVHRIARRFYECLASGGWLITASVDPPLTDQALFETVVSKAGVFYRRGAVPATVADPVALQPAISSFPASTIPTEPAPIPGASISSGIVSSATRTEINPTELARQAPLTEAAESYSRGDYVQVVELTRGLLADAAANALHVRALANLEVSRAEPACADAIARHPLCPELHYLHAVLLLDLGRSEEAARAVRRVIYLNRNLAIAHLTLGAIQERLGDGSRARKAYRNARELCLSRPADEPVALADGEHASRLAEAAAARLAILDSAPEKTA